MNTPTAASTERNQIADLLKGIAVLFMIQVHLVEQFATLEVFQSTFGRVSLFLGGPPAAPVFLAVMGHFLSRSRKSPLQHLQRGVLLILGGLLLNIGLNANLLYSIYERRFQLEPLTFIFGADILPLAGLSVCVLTLLRIIAKERAHIYLLAALLVALVTPLLQNVTNPAFTYVTPFFWGEAWWSYFPLFPWVAYPLIGFAFGVSSTAQQMFESLSERTKTAFGVVVVVLLASTMFYAFPMITELHLYYHHGILLVLWMSGFLFVWQYIASFVERSFGQSAALYFLKWIGRNVTSAYVFQWLLIGNLATELYRTQELIHVVGWFVAITLATSVLILFFRAAKQNVIGFSFR